MKIEVLYFPGCPNHEPTVERVRQVVDRLKATAEVREVQVAESDDPATLKFIGSPTVLINGADIDPAQRRNATYGFGCRTYDGDGVPSVAMIERAVHEAGGGGAPSQARSDATTNGDADRTDDNRSARWSSVAAVGSAVIASACCWLPLLLLAIGLTAGGVAGYFETARPVFLAAAAIFLGAGFYLSYVRRPACKPGDACAVPNPKLQRFNRAMLWAAAALVIAFALFPYYSPALIRASTGGAATSAGDDESALSDMNENLATYQFRIDGMTCSGCAAGLEIRVGQLEGVASAIVSYEQSTAVVQADPDRFDPAAFAHAVESAGFEAQRIRPPSAAPTAGGVNERNER